MSRKQHYTAYLASAAWQRRRARALKRVGYYCQDCGLYAQKGLHVHHLTYARLGAELDSDLRVLCKTCHEARHPGRRRLAVWEGGRFLVRRQRGTWVVWDKRRERVLATLPRKRFAIDFARGAESAVGAPASGTLTPLRARSKSQKARARKAARRRVKTIRVDPAVLRAHGTEAAIRAARAA